MNTHTRPATPLSTDDATRIDDIRISAVRPLITPALLEEWLPVPKATLALVEQSRAAISRVLHGADDRLIVVVGPCSIHDHAQAMDYARQLKAQADRLKDDLLLVMRVYFEKPRTTVGWKGYINDPRLDGSFAINEGLEMARQLLLDVLALGLPVGTGLREQVMIDVSHANSSKQYQRQITVAAEVAAQIAAGEQRITGIMIESHLNEGRQDMVPGTPLLHGVSVTDACISFEQTVPVLQGLAAAVRARRKAAPG